MDSARPTLTSVSYRSILVVCIGAGTGVSVVNVLIGEFPEWATVASASVVAGAWCFVRAFAIHRSSVATHVPHDSQRAFNFLIFWRYFAFVLPHKTRERVFDPAHEELLEDYLLTRRLRGKWARRWWTFCFTVRTALMILDCFRAMLADRAFQLIVWLIRAAVNGWRTP